MRKSTADIKPIPWDPLTSIQDNRSHPGEMDQQSFRLIQNWYFPDDKTLRRRKGFSKLLTSSSYHNADLHDQLLPLQNFYWGSTGESETDQTITVYPDPGCPGPIHSQTTGRQPITFLFQSRSNSGTRKLLAGSESRIYSWDEAGENWKIIADGMGRGVSDGTCPGRRFVATQNQDVVVFTNDYNPVLYWLFDQPTFGCSMQSVATIPDLDVIGLTRAGLCWTWRGCTFLADVEIDRTRYSNMMVWSDKDNALSYDPSIPSSIAGNKTLSPGEKILGHVELSDVCLVFTDQRIWQISAIGGEESFAFTPRFTPVQSGRGCLAYPNTIVSDGFTVRYAGVDGIYAYNLYSPEPEREEWIHKATKTVFSDIRSSACLNHIAVYHPTNPDTREIYFSWVAKDDEDGFPRRTLAIDIMRQRTSFIDYGMTAAVYYELDLAQTLRQWLQDQCACTSQSLAALGYGYVKEGLPKPKSPPPCDAINSIHTSNPITLDVGQPWEITTEDYTQSESDSDSFCARFENVTVQDLCPRCAGDKVFIFASSDDLCLKQLDQNLYREICTNPSDSGTTTGDGYLPSPGSYVTNGYMSILRSGPQHFGSPSKEKTESFFSVEAISEPQTSPITIGLRIGQSSQPVDSNRAADCSLIWFTEDEKTLECQSESDPDKQVSDGTRPDEGFRWPTMATGRYIYWELSVDGAGGDVSLGRVEQFVELTSRRGDV